jgi:putative ABC transport system permease protein
MADLVFDIKYAARRIAAQPSFALAVALTLALGLAVNASIFGIMDALLLRPFQFPDYQRIVVLFETRSGSSARDAAAPAIFLNWRDGLKTVEGLAAFELWGATLGGRTEPERLQGFRVSPGFFETLGIRPPLGRTFQPAEDEPGKDRVAIIGDGLWKRRFAGDPSVLGTELLLDGIPHTVVGIAPPGFEFPFATDVWTPLALSPQRAADRRTHSLTVLGKLTAGRTLADAQAELHVVADQIKAQHPDTHASRGATVRTLSTAFREGTVGSLMAVLQIGAGLVLLVACFNLAGLLLARAHDRQRDVAVRSALGASRLRIVRQLAIEVVLLAVIASILALIGAHASLELLRASIPADVARYIEGWNNVRVDSRLFVILPAFSILIGLVVGLVPAWSMSQGNLLNALRDSARGVSGGVRPQRARGMLVVAEIAFSLTLLVASGLAIAAGTRMIEAPSGFDVRSLLAFNVPLPESRYGTDTMKTELAEKLGQQLEAIPAVERAAFANILPASGWSPTRPLSVEDVPVQDDSQRRASGYRAVSAGFFDTMRIPIVSGRGFSSSDREGTQPVAIVSATLAARYWPGRDPIGRRVKVGDARDPWLTIVGVAGDVTMYNWWDGIDFDAVYVPLRQAPPAGAVSVAVRTRGEPLSASAAIRNALTATDPQLAIDNLRTMEQAIAGSTFGLGFMAYLMAICGAIALLLAAVGLYSLMAYAVSQRRHEFGVRMALGASAGDVLRLSMRHAGGLTAAGLLIGMVLAALLGQLMSTAFFGVVRLDLATFAGVAGGLAIVALAAGYIPALRSARVDPATVLRSQ